MVGWYHQLSGHEFSKNPGDNEGQVMSNLMVVLPLWLNPLQLAWLGSGKINSRLPVGGRQVGGWEMPKSWGWQRGEKDSCIKDFGDDAPTASTQPKDQERSSKHRGHLTAMSPGLVSVQGT